MGALNRWVYRVADGQLLMGGYLNPAVYPADSVNYALVDLDDTAPPPSPRLHRAASSSSVRAATAPEIAAYDLEIEDAKAATKARDKDFLAIFAVAAEAYNPSWAGMTNAQRKTEVNRLAGRFDQLRRWMERNTFA